MASSINASTSAGVVTTADTSGVLNIQTAGVTAVTVDASQKVGIGTASPATKLNVSSAGADVEVRASTTTSGNVRFGFDVDGAYYNWIQANRSSGAIQFAISNSEVMQINAVGGLKVINTIGVGNATPSTSGAGITFPATQSASSDANTLDDYEEGTWTGTDGSGAGLSITVNNARYTKIGRLVYVCADTIVYPVTANAAAAMIAGLPFTNGAGNIGSTALVSSNVNANRTLIPASTATFFFYASASLSQATNALLSGTTIYGFAAVYQV